MLRRWLLTTALVLAAAPAWAAATLFPTILVDGAGSDSLASGAGPGTAITGVACVSAADGLSVIIDGSPDITGVAVDGSAALYFADATAGQRNFARITATSGSGGPTATVTISEAVQAVQTKACAVGGKRLTIGSATSIKLFSNNSAAGDAMPGWAVEMQSGYTETLSATYTLRRAGNQTDGLIELRGVAAAATMPILTFSNNGQAITNANNIGFLSYRNFELRNSNATKTASEGVRLNGNTTASVIAISGLRIKENASTCSGNPCNFWKGIFATGISAGSTQGQIVNCDIRNTASHNIEWNVTTTPGGSFIGWNYLRAAAGDGIRLTAAVRGMTIFGNVIYNPTGDGINLQAVAGQQATHIINNTITNAGGDGIDIAADLEARQGLVIANNIISNNGGIGINWNSASAGAISGSALTVIGQAYYSNTGGDSDTPGYLGTNYTQAVNPSYTNASGDDFSIGSGLASVGWPTGGTSFVGLTSTTYSYVDPGAAQRVPSAGGTAASFYIGQ